MFFRSSWLPPSACPPPLHSLNRVRAPIGRPGQPTTTQSSEQRMDDGKTVKAKTKKMTKNHSKKMKKEM